jgi:hypothetical protein
MDDLTSIWHWMVFDATLNDLLYIFFHVALAGIFLYGVYDQKLRRTFRNKVRTLGRRLKNTTKTLAVRFRDTAVRLATRVQRWLWPPVPGASYTAHVKPIHMKVGVSGEIGVKVTRGEQSWTYFGLAFTVLSVLYIEINNNYHRLADSSYSIAILTADVAVLFWLCFYCGWFRNKIIGIAVHRNKTPD